MKITFSKITVIILIILINFLFNINIVNAYSGNLHLNTLEFKVNINYDGSMDVIELWNINIKNTNTLFKTFEINQDRYSNISNVKVIEKTNGKNYEFSQINEEMYHVTANSYYALENSNSEFEIAWGIGMDNSSGNRIYEISYHVDDAISKYNDYAEIYWQYIGEEFNIDADKIIGTIILPSSVNNIQEIKVWGHTDGLNGEIYATGEDEIKFEIDNYKSGNMIEIRALFPSDIIKSSTRTFDQDRYEDVVKEETKWVNKANLRREWEIIKDDVIFTLYIYIILSLCIIYIEKAVKYGKKSNKLVKFKPDQKLEYFRELPKKNVTPGEALYILEEPYNKFMSYFGNIFSANLLNLKLKGYIDFRIEKENKNKEKTYIKCKKDIKSKSKKVKEEEKEIFYFIKDAIKENEEIEINKLEEYISNNSEKVQKLIEKCQKNIEDELIKEKILNKEEKDQYKQYKEKAGIYYLMVFFSLVCGAFPLSIVFLIDGIICSKITKRTNVLTQEGINKKEKWNGIKKYMEDFSLIDKKEIPEIVIWEKYLVYATAFGIANKVLKQLKTVYPNIDELDTINTSTYIYFMYHSNFSTDFSSSINSSISSAYSSGTGAGGGFSSGGGGGRRPEEAVAADKTT